MLALAAPIFLIALPLIWARNHPASRILLTAGLAWALVAAVEWVLTGTPLSELLPELAGLGTVFVLTHLQATLLIALALCALGMLARLLHSVAWDLAAWLLHLVLVVATHAGSVAFSLVFGPVSDTFALATSLEHLNTVVMMASALALLLAAAFVLAAMAALLRHLLFR